MEPSVRDRLEPSGDRVGDRGGPCPRGPPGRPKDKTLEPATRPLNRFRNISGPEWKGEFGSEFVSGEDGGAGEWSELSARWPPDDGPVDFFFF